MGGAMRDGEAHRMAVMLGRSGAGLLALLVAGTSAGVLLGVSAGAAQRRLAQAVEGFVAGLPGLLAVVREATGLGAPVAAGVMLVIIAWALLMHRDGRLAGLVVVSGIGAAVLGGAVPAAVAALAPQGGVHPDGHTLASTVAYGLLLLAVAPALTPGWRRAAVAVAAVLVGAVGLTRLALGGLPSEVVTGWLLGAGWTAAAVTAFGYRCRLDLAAPRRTRRSVPRGVRPRPLRGWRAGALAGTWVLLLGMLSATGVALTGGATAPGGWAERFDSAVLGGFVAVRAPAPTAVAEVFSAIGDTPTIIAGALTLAVLAGVGTRSVRPAGLVVVVLVGEVTIFLVAAAITDRPRPSVPHLGLLLPPTSSFPSGHVSAALCLYGLAAMLAARWTPRPWRWAPPVAAVSATACVAFGRLYFGVHHPTDVLGSVLFALPWLLVCRHLLLPPPTTPVALMRAGS